MYKMLIADDEARIRSGLKNLIEWEVYGIEIVAEAENGTGAYLAIREHQPDIALVDVNMPNMSGLELLELCSRGGNCPRFVILSGYNDFEYVRTAMKYGAVNYLLKPIDCEELIHTMISTVRLLDNAQAHREHFQESVAALRNDILIRAVTGRIAYRELREKCSFVNLSFHCSNMRIALIKPVCRDRETVTAWLESAIPLFEGQDREKCTVYAAADEQDRLVLVLKDQSNQLTDSDYHDLLDRCTEQLQQGKDIPSISVLSGRATGISELPGLYEQCCAMLEHREIARFLSARELPAGGPPAFDYACLVQLLEQQDREGMKRLLHTHFRELLSQEGNLDTAKYRMIEFIVCAMQAMASSSLSDADIQRYKNEAFQIVRTAGSPSQIERKMLYFFENLMNRLDTHAQPVHAPLVQGMLNHIREHYSDPNLSLKTLAAQLNLNAAYLGRQFTLETNEYFSDYLTRIRIARAVHLLQSTDMKTAAIAEAVGFSSVSYFFTIFKKITGERPGDCRKS